MPASKKTDTYNSIFWEILDALESNPGDDLRIPYGTKKEAMHARFTMYHFRTALESDSRRHPNKEARPRLLEQYTSLLRFKYRVEETEDGADLIFTLAKLDSTTKEKSENNKIRDILAKHSQKARDKRIQEDAELRGSKTTQKPVGSAAPKVLHKGQEIKSSSEDGGQSLMDMFSNHGSES